MVRWVGPRLGDSTLDGHHACHVTITICLQCFDTVGLAIGRASGL